MRITADTTVHDLIERYPYLLDWLASYSPEFDKLKNPVLRQTMARFATMEAAAAMADTPLDTLLADIRDAVARHEIAVDESAVASGVSISPEQRAERQETLKRIIRRLHDGASVDDVKDEFDELVSEVDSAEIAQMEQALIAEGTPVEEVQRLCDVHVSVFRDALEQEAPAPVASGHPIDAYRHENERLTNIVEAIRETLRTLDSRDPATRSDALNALKAELDLLSQIDTHFTRKEHQLFPVLEKHEVEGPTKVMWGIDDDIRGRLKSAHALLDAGDVASLSATLPETLTMIDDMVYKEEKILLPTALQVITEDEWSEIAAGDPEIGYAWIDAPEGYRGASAAPSTAPTAVAGAVPEGPMLLPLPTGALSLEQLGLLFGAMPFDITYVDEDDRVRFYSEGERVFPRSPAAIGREVRNCHPPASVDKVEQILLEFRAGTKDVAEFWIEFHGRFIHIRYFALRDAENDYRGCLEVVQDATHVRSLKGQRRIVDW